MKAEDKNGYISKRHSPQPGVLRKSSAPLLYLQEDISVANKKPQYIFCASKKTRDGKTIYAKDYGLKAFRIPAKNFRKSA